MYYSNFFIILNSSINIVIYGFVSKSFRSECSKTAVRWVESISLQEIWRIELQAAAWRDNYHIHFCLFLKITRDSKYKILERFEPNGNTEPKDFYYNGNLLDRLIKNKFLKFDKSIKYAAEGGDFNFFWKIQKNLSATFLVV